MRNGGDSAHPLTNITAPFFSFCCVVLRLPSMDTKHVIRGFPFPMNDAKLSPNRCWLAGVGDGDVLCLVKVAVDPDTGTLTFGDTIHRIPLGTCPAMAVSFNARTLSVY